VDDFSDELAPAAHEAVGQAARRAAAAHEAVGEPIGSVAAAQMTVSEAKAPSKQPEPLVPKPVTSGGGRRVLGIAAAAIAAFLVTWFVLRPPGERPSNAPASAEHAPEPVPSPVTSAAPPAPPAEVATPSNPSEPPALAEPIAEPAAQPAPAPQAQTSPAKPIAKSAAPEEPRSERPTPAPAPEPAKPVEPAKAAVKSFEPSKAAEPKSGDAPFDKAAALSALSSAASAASGCRKEGDPSGMATVVITFAPSGRVTSANVNGPPFAGTPTGGCIASAMRRAIVPAFSGSHITVSRTVVIQ
jgi:hypothetical protein